MADGSLKFDTKIDTDGFEDGAQSLKGIMKELVRTIEELSIDIKNVYNGFSGEQAFKDTSSEVKKTTSEIRAMEQAIDDITISRWDDEVIDIVDSEQLDNIGTLDDKLHSVNTELTSGVANVDGLNKLLETLAENSEEELKVKIDIPTDSLEGQINVLKEKLLKLRDEGLTFGDINFDRAYQELLQATHALSDYKKKLQNDADTKIEIPVDVNSFEGQVQILKQKLQELRDEGLTFGNIDYDQTYIKLKNTEQALTDYRKSLLTVDEEQKKVAKSSGKMQTSLKGTNKAVIPLSKSILKLGNMFKLMLIRMAMRAVINGVKEGFQNLAQYSKQTNKDMSMVATSMLQLKNSFATAFAPIMTVVAPILRTLIDYLSQAITVMGQFFAVLLTGASTFTKAKKAQVDFAKSTKASGKEASKSLSPIDKLNQVGSDAGGGGGVDTPDVSDMFEEIKIDKKIIDFVDTVKEKFKSLGDYLAKFYTDWGGKDLFAGIKKGVNEIDFSNIGKSFKTIFKNSKEIAETGIQALQPIFKSGGKLLGTLLGYGIAIGGNTFDAILEGFANFTENMKGPIQEWMIETSGTITNTFENLNTMFEILGESWLETIQEYSPRISEAVEETLTNLASTQMLAGTIITDTLEIMSQKMLEFVEDHEEEIKEFNNNTAEMFLDAWDLINHIWSDALGLIKDFWNDWGKGIVEDVMDVLNDIGGWFLYLWNDLVKPIWDNMMENIRSIWDDSFKGMLKQLGDTVGSIARLIKTLWDNVFQPLINLFVKVLGPVVREVFNGIVNVIGTVVSTVGKTIGNLLQAFRGIIDFLTGVFSGDWELAWGGIVDIFSGVFNAVVDIAKGVVNVIVDVINGLVQGVAAGINAIIKGINKINFKVPDWVPGVGGKGVGFNLKEMSISKIPKLATGTVVPANYGEFMAILGDNTREPEVVSPLSTMKQAMAEVLAELGGMGGDITLNIHLSGKQIHTEVVKQDRLHKTSTGQSAFA